MVCSYSSFHCYLQVTHSRTTSISSYEKDFRELIETYTAGRVPCQRGLNNNNHGENFDYSFESTDDCLSNDEESCESDDEESCESSDEEPESSDEESKLCDSKLFDVSDIDENSDNTYSVNGGSAVFPEDYLEDVLDFQHAIDDLDGNVLMFSNCYMITAFIVYSLTNI